MTRIGAATSKRALLRQTSIGAVAAIMLLTTPACAQGDQDARAESADEPSVETVQDDGLNETAMPEAPGDQAEATQSVEGSVADEASKQIAEKRAALIEDAVRSIEESRTAVTALDEGDIEAALEALAVATGKLDIIVAREPELALAPISVSAVREDLIATVEGIEELREEIEELVDDGKIQQARPLVAAFGSEIIISTTSIPLATYPDAIKEVAAMIDDGEIEAAKVALDSALSTLIITERVVPLPLLRAEAMLTLAEEVLETQGEPGTEEREDAQADANETDPVERAAGLRENAAYQIQLAKAFGYGDEDVYEDLERDLDRLKNRIEDERDAGDLFASLRRQISELIPSDAE